jgi:hypothetical protein
MKTSLWHQHILPFCLVLGLLAVTTLAGDYLLHQLNLVWVGRYLGIPGIVLIIISLTYSLRKRKVIMVGNPKFLLTFHEFTAWLGSLLVLIHAGIHFNAILPWLATLAMSVNVLSGLVGKLLLGQSRRHVQGERDDLQLKGFSSVDAVTLDAMTKWRKVHIPIFIVFVILALGHIISILLFWGWV